MVQVLTDNKNRTVSEIRRLFTKHGGNLGESGCVAWMFDKKGLITVDKGSVDEDQLMMIALEGGAEDVREEDGLFEVLMTPESFETVRDRLEREKISMATAQVTLVPKNTVTLDQHAAEQTLKLTEELEDHEDVQNVAANFDIPNGAAGEGQLMGLFDCPPIRARMTPPKDVEGYWESTPGRSLRVGA